MVSARTIRGALSQGLALLCLVAATPGLAAPAEPAAFPMQVEEEKPEVLAYDPARPIPDGYVLRQRAPRGLVVTGGALFGAGYGLGVLAILSSGNKMDITGEWLFLPVFGPLVAWATQHKTCDVDYYAETASCKRDVGTQVMLANLFGMQAIGVALYTLGLIRTAPRLELAQPVSVRVVPAQFGHSGYGMAAVGQF
jgi:hypothetical protein